MAGKKYKARGRTVKKMTRNGLTEENLRDGSVENVSRQDADGSMMRSAERRLVYKDSTVQAEEAAGEPGKQEPGKPNASKRKNKYRFYEEKVSKGVPPARAAPLLPEEKTEDTARNKASGKRLRKQIEDETDRKASGLFTEEGEEEPQRNLDGVSENSVRMDRVREHTSGASFVRGTAEARHNRKKKMVQEYARKEKKAEEELSLSDFREEIEKKSRREQIIREQRKKGGRLAFDDEGKGMARGSGMHPAGKVSSAIETAVSGTVHGKLHEEEQENSAVEGAHKSELAAEQASKVLRKAQEKRREKAVYRYRLHEAEGSEEAKGRLKFGLSDVEKDRGTGAGADALEAAKTQVNRFWQKKRYKEAYAAAKQGKKVETEALKATETFAVKAKRMVQEIVRRNQGIFAVAGIVAVMFLLISVSLGSCAAVAQGGGSTVISTTYAADDADIYAAENYYAQMEAALNAQVNSMESSHPDYGDYQYQIDEISHNPYHLISYLTVKYGDFTFEQVKGELEELFREQYSISTDSQRRTVTETRRVRVGESLGQVVTSGYCNCSICCGQWAGGPTASGAMPTASHTIAVDASNPFVPMGTKVVMNGVEYTVEDTGNFAQYGVQFDVYYGDHASASAHGHQTWEAYIADDNGSQEIEVTSTQTVNQLNVTMTNHDLDFVLRSRMNEEEEERYGYYNRTYGNRDYLFDLNTLPVGGADGFGYQIPAEALSDERFARMIGEAEKYLGYPYVWGGASPETSFDCSGFVSWVINNCGNGWNVGRQTADGLRSCCAYVSPSEAKPGDLVFFQGTYDTPGASHVGIYVGNNMMIHCGNPIRYSSIATSYWQEHFMAFGRLP